MAISILVNGINLTTTYGLAVDGVKKWRSAPKITRGRFRVANRAGLMFAGPANTDVRSLVITGTMQQSTATLEVSNEDYVRSLLTAGRIRIAIDDGNGFQRQIEGYAEEPDVESVTASMVPLTTRWSIPVVCDTPYWRAAEPTIRVLSSTSVRYALTLGTAPSTPIIRVIGSATAPTLTYRDVGGATVRTLTLPTISANDWTDVDMRTGVVNQYFSGTPTIVYPLGSDLVWAFDPQDGDYWTSQWPSLQVSAGTAVAYWWNSYL